jgi:lipopolysaccharide transport system ATP-binding protein
VSQIVVENLSKRYAIGAPPPRNGGRAGLAKRLFGLNPNDAAPSSETRDFWALKDVSFTVEQGQRLGIIGRNGSGKSTLLKILSRITEPTEGRARLRGRVASLLEVGTGFHPELTGRENITLNGVILGMSRAEIRRKFDEIVDFAEIEEFLDTPVKRYSSGMYVRLAFAVAAHLESEILIVDEVLAVGDAAFQRKCMGKMESAGKDGRTVLFVSHSTATVTRLCTHGILLNEGRMVAHGPAQNVIHEYLKVNLATKTRYELAPDPSKDATLISVDLNPHRASDTNELSFEDDIVIRLTYDINVPTEDVTAWIMLDTVEGQHILVTADHDLDNGMFGPRRPGRYHADVRIPGKWLNVGEYVVIAGLVKNHPVIVYNREETVTFRILEIGTPASQIQEGSRPGALQPFLPWTLERA